MNERGFTLIEVVVTMVIAGIVACGMAVLIQMSSSQYAASVVESSLQMESQVFSNRVSQLLKGSMEYELYSNSNRYILEISSGKVNDAKEIENVYYYIVVDVLEKKSYLLESPNKVSNPLASLVYGNADYLANYIRSLEVNPSSSSGDGVVNVSYIASDSGKDYTGTFVVSLRNSTE